MSSRATSVALYASASWSMTRVSWSGSITERLLHEGRGRSRASGRRQLEVYRRPGRIRGLRSAGAGDCGIGSTAHAAAAAHRSGAGSAAGVGPGPVRTSGRCVIASRIRGLTRRAAGRPLEPCGLAPDCGGRLTRHVRRSDGASAGTCHIRTINRGPSGPWRTPGAWPLNADQARIGPVQGGPAPGGRNRPGPEGRPPATGPRRPAIGRCRRPAPLGPRRPAEWPVHEGAPARCVRNPVETRPPRRAAYNPRDPHEVSPRAAPSTAPTRPPAKEPCHDGPEPDHSQTARTSPPSATSTPGAPAPPKATAR